MSASPRSSPGDAARTFQRRMCYLPCPSLSSASPSKHRSCGRIAHGRHAALPIEQDHSSDCGNHSDAPTSSVEHRTGHAHGKSGGGGRVRKHIASIESTGGAAAQSPAAASSTSGASMRSSPRAKRSLPFAQGPPLAPVVVSSGSRSRSSTSLSLLQVTAADARAPTGPTDARGQLRTRLTVTTLQPRRRVARKEHVARGHSPGQKSAGGTSWNTPVRSRNASPARRPNSPGVVGSGGASRQRRAGSPPPALLQLGGGGSPECA